MYNESAIGGIYMYNTQVEEPLGVWSVYCNA